MSERSSTFLCAAEGIFIWPGIAVVERRGAFFVRIPDQNICNLAASLHGPAVIGGSLIPTLDRAARLLEAGKLAAAEASIARLKLLPLSPQGELLVRIGPSSWGKTFDPDEHPRWPAGSPDSAGGQFRPAGGSESSPSSERSQDQVVQEFPPFFARPPIVPEGEPEFQEPIPRLSGKEGAKDIPSWARGQRPYVGENGRDFAKRLMDEKYGPGKWENTESEYKRLQKYGDRNFRNPKSILLPDDNGA
ncbi:MAG: hypothetical protein ACREFL_08825 [Stellaceae bacterium]